MNDIDNRQDRPPRDEGECATVGDKLSGDMLPGGVTSGGMSPERPGGRREPANAGVLRLRAVEELRRLLPRMNEAAGAARVISFGLPELDLHLQQGGLAFGALHEVMPADPEDAPAALGFIMALLGRVPCLSPASLSSPSLSPACLFSSAHGDAMLFVMPKRWLSRHGWPYGHGLNDLGLAPARMIFTETADDKQSLWAIEEALRSSALTAVAGVLDMLDLKTSQRLQFTARETGLPLLVLRPSNMREASAATTRWEVRAAESTGDGFGLTTRWRLRLERCRNGRGGEWLVEFDHAAHCFSLAAALAGSAFSGGAGAPSSRRSG